MKMTANQILVNLKLSCCTEQFFVQFKQKFYFLTFHSYVSKQEERSSRRLMTVNVFALKMVSFKMSIRSRLAFSDWRDIESRINFGIGFKQVSVYVRYDYLLQHLQISFSIGFGFSMLNNFCFGIGFDKIQLSVDHYSPSSSALFV